MIKLGLIGYPLGHSLSPKIQTAALQACGLEGDYSLFPIGHDDKQGLKNLLDRVRTVELTGLNVTIPHKQNVIEFMDQLTPRAKSIGAVNTIYLREGKLIGDNTDAPGFMADLNRFITLECDSLLSHPQKNALVLGAGGSARAVVYALSNDGWDIAIASRRIEQAQELAAQFKSTNAIEFNFQTFKPSNFQLVVNTTPLGMTPNIDQSPWPGEIPFPKNAAIYDLVYNPPETKLVREARSQGLSATTGLGMLIGQAALAFELWTSHAITRDVLWNATENQLLTTGD